MFTSGIKAIMSVRISELHTLQFLEASSMCNQIAMGEIGELIITRTLSNSNN